MRSTARRRTLALGAGLLATALVLAGCGDGGGQAEADGPDEGGSVEEVPQDEIAEALATPTELTFWTWVPGVEEQVAMFTEQYPAITVKVENIGQGGAHYQTLRTALEAGQGLPDLVQMEYQYISSFVLTESLLDLAPFGAEEISGTFDQWVWDQVKIGSAIYAVPQDSGPMGNLYREDILAAAGITEAPATWDDYLAAARTLRETTDSYITNMNPNDPGQFVALLWAAGVQPFAYDGVSTIEVGLNSQEAKDSMAVWQTMLDEDLVTVDAAWTDPWYQGLANGTYAGWLTAAWGPMFLTGTAGDTAGLWRAAPLPATAAGVGGNWGGSSTAVMAATENPIAAYELAKWINTEWEPTLRFTQDPQFLFPTNLEVLQSEEFLADEVEFFGGQQVNEVFAQISGTIDTGFQWLPIMDYVYGSFEETVGVVITERGDLAAGLDAWQEAVVTYATQQGFTVN